MHFFRRTLSTSGLMNASPKLVTLLYGNSSSRQLANSLEKLFIAAQAPIACEFVNLMGAAGGQSSYSGIPSQVVESVNKTGVAVKCLFGSGGVDNQVQSMNLALRKEFNFFANVRLCKSIEGIPTRYKNVNIVTIRENTEGEYSGIEHNIVDGVVQSLKLITETASRRIAKFAFEYAKANGRRSVVAVHKANIMKMSDGLFLRCCQEEASKHPNVEFQEMILDTVCLNLPIHPTQFDVLLLPNLYGDILRFMEWINW